jgi:hypothetical protein
MADTVFRIPPEKLRQIRPRQIDGLPYGMLEITAEGTILNYFPSQAPLLVTEPPQICGRNLFVDLTLGEIFPGLRQVILDLLDQGGGSERFLLVCSLAHQTIRLSVVVTARAEQSHAHISLVRLSS